jgi:hypothetical protein
VAADALTKSLRNPTGARLVPARTLLILQYIVLLYPTSDLRHAVTTPCVHRGGDNRVTKGKVKCAF